MMAVNTKGVWLCCKYAIAQMLKQEPLETGSRGKIVNIASAAALIARAGNHAYGASKAAVVHLGSGKDSGKKHTHRRES